MRGMMSMMMMMFWWVDGEGNNIGRGYPVANFYSITLVTIYPSSSILSFFSWSKNFPSRYSILSILKSDKANYFMNEPITKQLRCILLFDYLYINY